MQNSTEQLIVHFKALADPVRLRLLALCARGECTVGELTRVLGLSQPRVSQHLKVLCEAGLLQRFRDGHFVYCRVPARGGNKALRDALLALLPTQDAEFERDLELLRESRVAAREPGTQAAGERPRELHRVLIELTVSTPLGDVIDIGSGRGDLLKLLASRARRVVGVDIDADARQLARAELLHAGIENCSLRKGDMYALPFAAAEFDTVILDGVLGAAREVSAAIREGRRILRPGGRLLVIDEQAHAAALQERYKEACLASGLRLAAPRRVGEWFLSVASLPLEEPAAA